MSRAAPISVTFEAAAGHIRKVDEFVRLGGAAACRRSRLPYRAFIPSHDATWRSVWQQSQGVAAKILQNNKIFVAEGGASRHAVDAVGRRLTEEAKVSELAPQLRDYRLTTAEIIYYLPDHPSLLQSFVWQHLDIAPEYPRLRKFLEFWESSIEGKLHSVRVGQKALIGPAKFRAVALSQSLH